MSFVWKNYRYTTLLFSAGLLHFTLHFILQIDTFERLIELFETFEHYELDELFFIVVFTLAGIAIDVSKSIREERKQHQRAQDMAKAMHVTLRTVNDIVGNTLNQLSVVQLEIDANSTVSESAKNLLDELIHSTKHKLIQLSEADEFTSHNLGDGLEVLDYKLGDKQKPS